jgi:hypothetical protein
VVVDATVVNPYELPPEIAPLDAAPAVAASSPVDPQSVAEPAPDDDVPDTAPRQERAGTTGAPDDLARDVPSASAGASTSSVPTPQTTVDVAPDQVDPSAERRAEEDAPTTPQDLRAPASEDISRPTDEASAETVQASWFSRVWASLAAFIQGTRGPDRERD